MQGTFSDIIVASWEWTKTILFRPFRPKKWILLCIIALLAAEFSGCNININAPFKKPNQEQIQQKEPALSKAEDCGKPAGAFGAEKPATNVIPPLFILPVIILLFLTGILLVIFFLWIHSRFSFVFLNSITKNDASIKIPFFENKYLGNSLFKWNLLFLITIILALSILILILIGILSFLPLILKIILSFFWGVLLVCTILLLVMIHIIIYDISLPIMFKDRIGIIQAWKKSVEILRREKLNFILYLLIKTALRILAVIMAGLFTIAIMIALLMQLSVIGGLLYSASFIIPKFLKFGYYALLILLGIAALIAIIFLINLVLLPIPVFFRTYSLKFLSRLDERYNLFQGRNL